VIARNARLILITDVTILLSTVVSSLLGARALGPAGRGDLLVVVLWPPVVAMMAGLGLPSAYRYWMAKEPEKVSQLFTNAVIYTAIVGITSIALADLIVPHLVGDRSPQVRTLLRIYQINIPAALFLDLMRGLLEGTRRFGWAGIARLIFFGVQGLGFAGLWSLGRLTVTTATVTMITAQTASMVMALTTSTSRCESEPTCCCTTMVTEPLRRRRRCTGWPCPGIPPARFSPISTTTAISMSCSGSVC